MPLAAPSLNSRPGTSPQGVGSHLATQELDRCGLLRGQWEEPTLPGGRGAAQRGKEHMQIQK